MIDVAIVGAGLTGLTLARRLRTHGVEAVVFDVRVRTGGRILSVSDEESGVVVDMGATWYWPDTEPRIAHLIRELGLASFEQPDDGRILNLTDPAKEPETLSAAHVHGGARRVTGGMGRVITALAEALPAEAIRLGCRLRAVRDQDSHVELQFTAEAAGASRLERVQARRVVLAMPPRLVAEHLQFVPVLPLTVAEALAAVPTWMAREAKVVARFERPFWHDEGCSGSAFGSHPQAVLREVWDASDVTGAALAGFMALGPRLREQFSLGMPLLVSSQLAQWFGPATQSGDLQIMDWARESWTCSQRDGADEQPQWPQADPVLRRPHWSGRLYFGGSETARQAAGHMEGALESAARLADFLRPVAVNSGLNAGHTDAAVRDFTDWVGVQRQLALPRYRQQLTQMLSRQDQVQLTQRALLTTVEQTYSGALEYLAAQDCWASVPDEAGRRVLVPTLLTAFSGFSKALVDEALLFNAGSCALSNFPDEHQPSAPYVRAITADLAAAWREFAWSVNDLLHARGRQAA